MMKALTSFTILALLTSCNLASGVASRVLPADEADKVDYLSSNGVLTREAVEASQIAMVSVKPNPASQYPVYFVAQSDSNGTVSYGKAGRQAVTMRGGLVNGQYILGGELLGVKVNANDPIQFQRLPANWPSSIARTYQLPGDGLDGDERRVECHYSNQGAGVTEIVGMTHQTQLISEHCQGDGLDFENSYMVDASGFVWKSEQWTGLNPSPIIIEIVEPLD